MIILEDQIPKSIQVPWGSRSWSQLTVTSWDLMTFATVPWRTFDATIQRANSQAGRGRDGGLEGYRAWSTFT